MLLLKFVIDFWYFFLSSKRAKRLKIANKNVEFNCVSEYEIKCIMVKLKGPSAMLSVLLFLFQTGNLRCHSTKPKIKKIIMIFRKRLSLGIGKSDSL